MQTYLAAELGAIRHAGRSHTSFLWQRAPRQGGPRYSGRFCLLRRPELEAGISAPTAVVIIDEQVSDARQGKLHKVLRDASGRAAGRVLNGASNGVRDGGGRHPAVRHCREPVLDILGVCLRARALLLFRLTCVVSTEIRGNSPSGFWPISSTAPLSSRQCSTKFEQR